MPTTLSQLRKAALNHNADVTVTTGRETTVSIDTPKGKTWDDNACHVICETYLPADGNSGEVYDNLIARMAKGTTDCNCERCQEPDDF